MSKEPCWVLSRFMIERKNIDVDRKHANLKLGIFFNPIINTLTGSNGQHSLYQFETFSIYSLPCTLQNWINNFNWIKSFESILCLSYKFNIRRTTIDERKPSANYLFIYFFFDSFILIHFILYFEPDWYSISTLLSLSKWIMYSDLIYPLISHLVSMTRYWIRWNCIQLKIAIAFGRLLAFFPLFFSLFGSHRVCILILLFCWQQNSEQNAKQFVHV